MEPFGTDRMRLHLPSHNGKIQPSLKKGGITNDGGNGTAAGETAGGAVAGAARRPGNGPVRLLFWRWDAAERTKRLGQNAACGHGGGGGLYRVAMLCGGRRKCPGICAVLGHGGLPGCNLGPGSNAACADTAAAGGRRTGPVPAGGGVHVYCFRFRAGLRTGRPGGDAGAVSADRPGGSRCSGGGSCPYRPGQAVPVGGLRCGSSGPGPAQRLAGMAGGGICPGGRAPPGGAGGSTGRGAGGKSGSIPDGGSGACLLSSAAAAPGGLAPVRLPVPGLRRIDAGAAGMGAGGDALCQPGLFGRGVDALADHGGTPAQQRGSGPGAAGADGSGADPVPAAAAGICAPSFGCDCLNAKAENQCLRLLLRPGGMCGAEADG